MLLLYTLPMNINGYVPFLILLYTLPMNINGYAHSSYCYIPYLWTLMAMPIPHIVIYPTYEYQWVCPNPHKYVGHYCEVGNKAE